MSRLHASDLAVIAGPPAVGVALSHINLILGAISLCLGIAFQIWKWRREAKTPLNK